MASLATSPKSPSTDRRPAPPPCARLFDVFFSDDPDDVKRAKSICSACGARRRCLDEALARRESCGVWGGELVRDGLVLPETPRRGRPRSVA